MYVQNSLSANMDIQACKQSLCTKWIFITHKSRFLILMVKFYLEPSLDSWTKNWMRRQTMRTCGQSHSIPFCSELTWKPQFRCLKEGTHVYD